MVRRPHFVRSGRGVRGPRGRVGTLRDRPGVRRRGAPAPAMATAPGLPFRFDGAGAAPLGPAPVLGQHTDQVLAELLGLSAHEVGRLHDEDLVAGPGRSRGGTGAGRDWGTS